MTSTDSSDVDNTLLVVVVQLFKLAARAHVNVKAPRSPGGELHGREILTVLLLELVDEVLAEVLVSTNIEHVAEEGPRQIADHDIDGCQRDRGGDVILSDPHPRLRQDNWPNVDRIDEELVATNVEHGAGLLARDRVSQDQVLQRVQIEDRVR